MTGRSRAGGGVARADGLRESGERGAQPDLERGRLLLPLAGEFLFLLSNQCLYSVKRGINLQFNSFHLHFFCKSGMPVAPGRENIFSPTDAASGSSWMF